MNAPELIAFDFFGVICPPMYGGLLRDVFPGDDVKWKEWMHVVEHDVDIGDLPEDDFIARLSAATQIDFQTLKDRSYEYAVLNDGLLSIISDLKKKYKIGLLTNAPRSLIENILKGHIALFDTVTISADVHLIKPDPVFFEHFIEQTGVRRESILFFDDNQKNVEAAQVVGLQAAQFVSNEKLSQYLLEHAIL